MRNILSLVVIFAFLCSCEEVINIELNSASPSIVAEAKLFKDSVAQVCLSNTTGYFSVSESDLIEDAEVWIRDGITKEKLDYIGKGYYRGSSVKGKERGSYSLEITHSGNTYDAVSTMPSSIEIESVNYFKSTSESILNPSGKPVLTINCQFYDEPGEDNYYMIYFMADGRMIEERYFMLTEKTANGGSFSNINNRISFSESIFYDGTEVEMWLFSIDEPVYNYFYQLDDILFWKRRFIPPTPYNPESNISNGVMGFFAAWVYDSVKIKIE
jgi:hypothetical protein